MKNKKKIIHLCSIFILFFFNIALSNEKIDYSSNTIKILENGNIYYHFLKFLLYYLNSQFFHCLKQY